MQRLAARACAGALLIVAACRHAADNAPSPHVVCDDPSPGFGRILQGEAFTHAFRLRNTGSGWLRIDRVDPSYSCLAEQVPALIAPGQSADVRVRCNASDRQNRMVDRLVLHCNDPTVPELTLAIEADVEPLLALTSRTVDLQPPLGGRDSREVSLVGLWAHRARLAVETVEPEGPQVEVVPAPDGGVESVRVGVRGDRVGRSAGQVVLTTGLIKPATLTLLYSWKVMGNLVVEPTNPVIDLRAPGPTGAVVRVSSGRRDFRLHGAQVVQGPFEANVSRDPDSRGYSISVRVAGERLRADERGRLGTLRLLSNDPAEPRKDVPLFALGARD